MQVLAPNYFQAAVGQCKLIVQISQQMKWAHGRVSSRRALGCCGPARSYHQGYGICIAGQCSHLGWQLSPLTIYCEGPHSSLVQHLILCLMGQCKLVVQILQHMKWAHISACTQLLSGCCGPVQADSPNITANEMGPWEDIKHKSFQAAVGQLGLIIKAMASALQANVATLVSSYPH